MKSKKLVQDWERNHINALTLRLILAATLGTLGATALAFILKKAGIGDINPELLFIPWGVALVYGVSTSFRHGVMAERARAEQAED